MALESRSQTEAQSDDQKVVRLGCILVAFAALASGACGATSQSEKTNADLATMQKETTPEKLLERGKGFAQVGDMTRAEEYLGAALEAGAPPREALPLLFTVCVQSGRYRSAIQYAENHLRRHPDDMRTRFVLGTLYAAVGENKAAEDELVKVIAARPNDSNAHYALGVLSRDNDNDAIGADKHFREYLRLEPNGSHAEEARASLLKQVPQQP